MSSDLTQRNPVSHVPFGVSGYDRINSGLIVSLMLGSAALALLTLAWLFSGDAKFTGTAPKPLPPPTPVKPKPVGQASLFDQAPADSKPLEQAVEQVGSVVAKLSLTKGLGGDGVLDGFGGDGVDPRETVQAKGGFTWSVKLAAEDFDQYQRKLDFFGIEIGVVHKTRDDIWRVSNLSAESKVSKSNRAAEASSHRFQNRNRRLRHWDFRIAQNAGLDVNDALVLVVHFYSPELIERMQQLLAKRCGERLGMLKQAEFCIVGDVGEYRFEVDSVEYHGPEL